MTLLHVDCSAAECAGVEEESLLSAAACSLYKLHQRRQRFGATGVSEAELHKAVDHASALSARHFRTANSSGGFQGSAAPPQLQPLALFLQGLCTCLMEPGRDGAAAATPKLQAAVKLEPCLLQAWLVLAYCAYEQGDTTQAISCVARGLRMQQHHQHSSKQGVEAAGVIGPRPMVDTAGITAGTTGADTKSAAATEAKDVVMNNQQQTTGPTDAGPGACHGLDSGNQSEGVAAAPLVSDCAAVLKAGDATKEGLQLLSMLVRQEQQQWAAQDGSQRGSGKEREADPQAPVSRALELSRHLANAALEMDLEDPYSWYVLALSELSAYLQAPLVRPGASASRPRQLQRLLASFSQAERRGLSDLADLYYNRATLHTYCQSFAEALQDYARAKALDPSLPVDRQSESLVALASQLSSLVASRGGVKPKQWTKITAVLAKDAAKAQQLLGKGLIHHQPGLTLAGLTDLSPGHNHGRALLCRPLVFISPPLNASAALYIVCVDTSACCLALALVRISHSAFDMNQQLTIISPELLNVRLQQGRKEMAFPMLKVDGSDSILLVDGVPVQQD